MSTPGHSKYIFVDHSNVWGGARLATKIRDPQLPDWTARISVTNLDKAIGGNVGGVAKKIASGGIPPGMEGLWAEYQKAGYDTQRLYRDENWKERGVDHNIIGHMWRLLAQHRNEPVALVLASGDGRVNEFGTSFFEVLQAVLAGNDYPNWNVELFSFDWAYPNPQALHSPTKQRMRRLVEGSPRGRFVNLLDHYQKIVYHES